VAQGLLRELLIIDLDVALDGIGQVRGGVEAGGTQHVGDAAVEAFDHTIGLRGSGRDEPMLDTVVGTDAIKSMGTGRLALAGSAEAVGKFLTIVGEDLSDCERRLLDQALEETAGRGCRFVLENLHVHPAGGAINGGEEVLTLVLIRHLGEVLEIDAYKAGGVSLEGLHRRLGAFILGHQGLEVGDSMAAQTAVQAGAGEVRVDELTGHRQQVIQGQ